MSKIWNIFQNLRHKFPVSSIREQGIKRRLCRLEILEDNNPLWTESGLYNNYAIDCYTDGTGRAFDELCAAINYRGQTKVSLIGYSHGGGSVYNLSKRLAYDGIYNPELNQTFPDRITQNYQLVFTSDIDGITNTFSLSPFSETRFPINSEYHLNQYQRSSYYDTITNITWCWGNELIGAENLDRTSLGVVHSTIDENPDVLESLSNRFHARGVR